MHSASTNCCLLSPVSPVPPGMGRAHATSRMGIGWSDSCCSGKKVTEMSPVFSFFTIPAAAASGVPTRRAGTKFGTQNHPVRASPIQNPDCSEMGQKCSRQSEDLHGSMPKIVSRLFPRSTLNGIGRWNPPICLGYFEGWNDSERNVSELFLSRLFRVPMRAFRGKFSGASLVAMDVTTDG